MRAPAFISLSLQYNGSRKSVPDIDHPKTVGFYYGQEKTGPGDINILLLLSIFIIIYSTKRTGTSTLIKIREVEITVHC